MANKVGPVDLSKYYKSSLDLWFSSRLHPLSLISPLEPRDTENHKGFSLGEPTPSIEDFEIASGIALIDETHAKALEIHQGRLKIYLVLRYVLRILIYFFIGTPFFVGILLFLQGLGLFNASTSMDENIIRVVLYILIVISLIIAMTISDRITAAFLDRSYSDTLAFVTTVYSTLSLMKENSLLIPAERKQILTRTHALRKYIGLLSYQYRVPNSNPNSWASQKFQQMKHFIEENESRIIAPHRDTSSKMVKEMRSLSEILLTANYGDFEFQSSIPDTEEPTVSTSKRIVQGMLKTIGILTPVLLLLGIYLLPEQFEVLGFDNKIVALISLAWFLLAIDINLNLGIVDRVSGLAKTFRELQ